MIKKLLGVFICIVFTMQIANASELSEYCAEPHDLSLKTTRFFETITAFTPLTQAVANSVIKKELKKATGTKGFKVKMKSYSANDLIAGRFKSLDITGKNLNFDGIYVSDFSAKTVCDFNYIKATTKSVNFVDNFPMTYSLTISETDLKRTVISENYMKFLKSLNTQFGKISLLELKDVDVKLKNDKFYFILKMNNKIFNKNIHLSVNLSAKMKVEDGNIKVTEVTSEGINQKINLTQVTNLLNLINPLTFTTDIMGNKYSRVALKNLDIKGDKLYLDGTLLIPKNTQESRK